MADHKSAAKRARQGSKKNLRNKSYITMVKSTVKKYLVAAQAFKAGQKTKAEVDSLLTVAQSALHKAVSKGMLHKNNASRRVSRLAHMIAGK